MRDYLFINIKSSCVLGVSTCTNWCLSGTFL